MSQPTKARGHGAATNHHREAGTDIIPPPEQKNKERIMNYSPELTAHEEIPHSMIQDDIETLRKRILEMLDRLSDADCAEVYATLKERGVL